MLSCVLEELLNQIDVRHDHSAAAVSLASELVHGITVAQKSATAFLTEFYLRADLPIRSSFVNEFQISLPEVTNDLGSVSLGMSPRSSGSLPCHKKSSAQE